MHRASDGGHQDGFLKFPITSLLFNACCCFYLCSCFSPPRSTSHSWFQLSFLQKHQPLWIMRPDSSCNQSFHCQCARLCGNRQKSNLQSLSWSESQLHHVGRHNTCIAQPPMVQTLKRQNTAIEINARWLGCFFVAGEKIKGGGGHGEDILQ